MCGKLLSSTQVCVTFAVLNKSWVAESWRFLLNSPGRASEPIVATALFCNILLKKKTPGGGRQEMTSDNGRNAGSLVRCHSYPEGECLRQQSSYSRYTQFEPDGGVRSILTEVDQTESVCCLFSYRSFLRYSLHSLPQSLPDLDQKSAAQVWHLRSATWR